MSFDTSNIPCSTQISVHNSEKAVCIGSANSIIESVDSQLLKTFILSNKEYRLNICAILQDVNANFCIDKIEEFMNTIDYDCIKTRQNAFNDNLKFDVLIYGYSKRGNTGIDLELLVDEQYSESDESKQAVCTVSRQLMESINTIIKSSSETSLMFCIECGLRMWNETDCRLHAIHQHNWTLNDDQWGHSGSNAVVLQAQYEHSNECIINRFTHVDWLEKQFPISIPFLIPAVEHANYRRDIDQSQSSPSLSILPSWTTATSPMCVNCDTVFSSTIELEEHTRLNHQGSNTSVNRCGNRPLTTTTKEYRCNICNYKTVTKGNLHIHFQSEKHRNNQREHDQNEHKGHIHNQDPSPIPSIGSIPQLHILDSFISRAQNDFFSNIKVSSFSSNWSTLHNNDQNKDSSSIGLPIEAGLNNMAIFKCEICHNYSHSDIEIILDHAERPRPLPSNSEVSKVVRASIEGSSGVELEHVCMLDGYKTRIKANFLLHFKTEKHQQKLQLLAHAGEGGLDNANKIMLQMVTEQTSLISIHCSLCRATFSTAHKLRLHVDSSDHQINQKIANSFHIWKKSLETNNNFKDEKIITGFECKPCGSVFRRYIEVLDHFHVQKNSIHMAVFKQEMDINSLVKVHYYNKSDKTDIFNASTNESIPVEKSEIPILPLFRCNLCNDPVDRKDLRTHLREIHKIQDHCVDQLINLAEKAHVETITKMLPMIKSLKLSDKPREWCDCVIIKETENLEPMVRCQQCGKCFATVSMLEEHRAMVKHNDILDHRGHLCYKKGCNQYFKSISLMIDHFYEIHAFQIPEYKRLESFKYVCKVCHILAFNCAVKCYQHMNSHSLFGEFDCVFCGLTTKSRSFLRSHIENYHIMQEDIVNHDSKTSPENTEIIKSTCELVSTTSSSMTVNDCQSTFSSPESVVNKENRNQTASKNQEYSTSLRNNLGIGTDNVTPRINSLTSISSLIATVGLENVKLVIETMINSKCDQNENDSMVWKFAESIIDVANIKETLIEKCRECGKLFSSQAVLKKHDKICLNPSTEILREFERIVSVCRDHLTRMMLTHSNDTTRKPLFVSINSHTNETFREDNISLQTQQLRPNISCEDPISNFTTKFSSTQLLNINRSMIQPMLNPYRFHPNNHTFLNILPPLGMFPMPQFRFRNLNSPNAATNLSFFNNKPPSSNSTTNSNLMDHQKVSDSSQKIDNFNRKRTQIKNHQYDILRSYFNINNPPNDETIAEIIEKTGLDKKTVKHWFRNTLFKERQRCKDSPYNFNIPPETSLNIEEYEKTGKIEVKSECSRTSSPIDKNKNYDDTKTDASSDDYKIGTKRSGDEFTPESTSAKIKRITENKEQSDIEKIDCETNHEEIQEQFSLVQNFDKQEEIGINNLSSNSKEKTCLANKKDAVVISISPHNEDVPLDLSYQNSGFNILNGSRNSFTFDPISPFESEQEPIENCSSNCGERRHRTTLTAMQIQAMKSIFIHCRSPSHNELGILGNVLSLDMRVVQVWFQNQRAKLKKQERDLFYREKPVFPEATPSIIELPKCDRIHCLVCNQNINSGISKQAHIFSNDHLIILMRYLVTKSNDMKLNWKSESNSL